MSLYLGIILGLIAMLGFGISKVYLKKLVQSAGVYSIAYTNSLMVLILFLVSIFAVKFQLPSFKLFCIIAALGFVGAFSFLLFMKAMKIGSVAVVVPVSSGFGVIIVALAVLVLKESLTIAMITGIALVIIGTILVSFKYSDLRNVPGHMFWSAGTGLALLTALG